MFTDAFVAEQRVLVIAPHADDETYGMRGDHRADQVPGGEVYVVLVSVADVVQYSDSDDSDLHGRKLVTQDTRLAEFESVVSFLKVDDWDVLLTDEQSHLALD